MKDISFYRGREQTFLKHFALEHYLERLSWIIGYSFGKMCYVDGFSGPWKSVSDDYGDTSIKISLDILERTKRGLLDKNKSVIIKCIFVEKNKSAFSELGQILKEKQVVGIETIPLEGEFEDLIDEILHIAEGFFTLFFVDPSGWTGYGLEKIAPIIKRPKSELLINFMFDPINRFLTEKIDESLAKGFDELFGNSGWRGKIPEVSKRESAILDYYKECIKANNPSLYVVNSPVLKPTVSRTYFHLIYCTSHPKGLQEFKRIDQRMQPIQKDIRQQAIYRKQVSRTRQESMFGYQIIDTDSIFKGRRNPKLIELYQLFEKWVRSKRRFSFKDFCIEALQIEMIYEEDVKDLILDAKRSGKIDIPNWQVNQKKPKDKNIIQKRNI